MSNPPNTWLSNSNFNKFKGTYFNNDVDCSGNIICRTGNLYLASNSNIYSPTNSITFDDTYQYTNFNNNVHIIGSLKLDNGINITSGNLVLPNNSTISTSTNSITFDDTYAYTNFNNNVHIIGTEQLDYGGTTYDVGYEISTSKNKLTNITYNSTTNTTDITGNLTIPSTALSGSYCDLSNAQTINGIKTFGSPPVMSGASITASTIPNSALASNYITTDTSQTIASTGTKTWQGIQTFQAGGTTFQNGFVAGSTTITNQVLNFISTLTSNAQTQFGTCAKTNAINTFTNSQTFQVNIRMDTGSLILNSNTLTLTNANLQKIQYLSTVSSDVQTQINNKVDLTTAQTIAGIKTFSSAPVMSGASITSATIPNSALATSYVDLTTAQTIGGVKTFSSAPVMSGASITASTIPNSALATSYVDLSTAQTIGGIKTFSSAPVMSGASITSATIPDSALVLGGAYVNLSTAQTVGGSKTFSNTITASAGISTASGQSYTSAGDTRLTSASASTTYINNDKTSGDLRFNTSSTSSNTYFDNGNVQINHANSTGAKFSSGSLTGGGGTDYCEGLNLTCGNYGLQIQGGLKQTVGDRFNICFYNNNAPVSVLSATNTGTPANNVVDLTGVFRINGTNVLDNSVLIGSISMFPFTLGSPQYCLCDGRAISRTTYSILFALMGTTYGSGNGSTTFNVPNFSGIFLRGNGSQVINSNTYASASIGTAQQDSLLDHVHNGASSSYLSGSTTGASTNGIASVCSSTYIVSSSFPNTGSVNSTYRSNTTENRPVNHSINYYIKVL